VWGGGLAGGGTVELRGRGPCLEGAGERQGVGMGWGRGLATVQEPAQL
jgi:hypothetical protein